MTARAVNTVSVLIMVAVAVAAAPDTNTWIRAQPQQTLHGLMVSIDERLQTLENARLDATLKQAEKKLDSLESSIRRLDSTLQDRLDKLERSLDSKELKDELSVEKMTHKIRDLMDASYDRYNRRLGFTEEKLEMVLNKLQLTTEASFNRLEKQQEDVQTEVLEAVTLLEDLRSQTTTAEDKLNHTHKAIQQHIERIMTPSQEELQRISGSLKHLGTRLNGSLVPVNLWSSQNDGPATTDIVASLRRDIGSEGIKITNKINNMYNDLWPRLVSVEALIKELNRATNSSYRKVITEVRSLANPDNREFPGDSQENFLEVALEALERKLLQKLTDVGRKVEGRLDTLGATQNLIMDSCFDSGVCQGLESRLSQVLEKIFVVLYGKIEGFSNRTLDLDGLVVEMMELVKSQHTSLIKTVTHNTNMVVTLAKDSSEANKLLHHTVSRLANRTEDYFQELQEEVQDISNRSEKICLDSKKSSDSNVSSHHDRLDTFTKNSTSDTPVYFSTTEAAVREITKQTSIVEKNHDAGILKITDDFGALADNNSVASASMLKPVIMKPSRPLALDSSILQVIELVSSNLTQSQKNTLMQLLNSSISLDNLEAVIQNTEAETDYDTSVEMYDAETLNKTGVEEEFSTTRDSPKIAVASDVSVEMENIPEDETDDLTQSEATTIEVAAPTNGSTTSNDTEGMPSHVFVSIDGVPEYLKTQLKYYAIIMKIKQGNFNVSEFWKPQQVSNSTDVQNRQKLLPYIENLCYGEENILTLTSDRTNTKMRDRLLMLNQIIRDKDLYEKIENICNTMTESLATNDVSDETLPED